MNFSIEEILVGLLLAAIAGGAISWFIRTFTIDKRHLSRIQVLEYERGEYKKGITQVKHDWNLKYQGLQNDRDEIEVSLANVRVENSRLSKQTKRLNDRLSRRIYDNEILARSFHSVHEERNALNKENKKLKEAIEKLQAEHSQLLLKITQLKTSHNRKVAKNLNTSEAEIIEKLKAASNELSEKLISTEAINDALTHQVDDLQADQTLLQHQKKDLLEEIASLQHQLSSYEVEISEIQQTNQHFQSENDYLHTQREELESKLRQVTQERDGFLIEKIDLEKDYQQLKSETSEIVDAKEKQEYEQELLSKIDDLKHELEQKGNSYLHSLNEKEQQIESLNQTVQELQNNTQNLNEQELAKPHNKDTSESSFIDFEELAVLPDPVSKPDKNLVVHRIGEASLELIPDITKDAANSLEQIEILNLGKLLDIGKDISGREFIAKQTGFKTQSVLKWVNQADLLRLNNIDNAHTQLLTAAGIDSIRTLRCQNTNELTKKLHAANQDQHLLPESPDESQIAQWIQQARQIPAVVSQGTLIDEHDTVHLNKDNLTQIKGIGRINENILQSIGINTFAQIANLTDEDEKRVGDALGSFKDRIANEKWIEQAKQLHKAKYGEDI